MNKRIIEFDPKTGQARENHDLSLQRSYDIDDVSESGYIYTANIDGHAVYCNPISDAAMDALAKADAAFQDGMKQLGEEVKAISVSADEAKNRSFAIVNERRAAYVAVLTPPVIVGWELPDRRVPGALLPFNTERIAKLPTDVIISLVTQIQQKQTLGQTEADFLAKR